MTGKSLISAIAPAFAIFLASASVASAQAGPRATEQCEGRTINEIRVTALRPPFTGEAKYWRQIARSIGLHHRTTDTAVVRRFLALETGGQCTDFRMRESARLLREQPFLADARIRGVPDDSGGVRVEVETVDEIPALVSASFNGHLSYLEIGNQNMFGDAWLLAIHGADRPLAGRSAGFAFFVRMSMGDCSFPRPHASYSFSAAPQLFGPVDFLQRSTAHAAPMAFGSPCRGQPLQVKIKNCRLAAICLHSFLKFGILRVVHFRPAGRIFS